MEMPTSKCSAPELILQTRAPGQKSRRFSMKGAFE
nr:MAG TPA: hypothetical protein [Caudoviricetes sp.]DAL04013.1 MAG TPA: hypothetical protein [Caudoviricetes sp.]DAY65421.1 MAG TPA: hypothetical protein [Caudoviricetes sp.]